MLFRSLANIITLPTGFAFVNGTTNTDTPTTDSILTTGTASLNARDVAAGSWVAAIENTDNSIFVFYVEGNSTDSYGCFVGSDATGTSRDVNTSLTRMLAGQGNYL